MKCPKCFDLDTRVLQTRSLDSGIIARRRHCQACGHRFTTHELPPGAFSYARSDIQKWEQRATGDWKTKVSSRKKLARQMCEMRAGGATCQDIAVRFGQSVHMAYYYTQPKRMREFGFAVEQAAAAPAVGAHWGGLVQ